jgi:hypothetical protein
MPPETKCTKSRDLQQFPSLVASDATVHIL